MLLKTGFGYYVAPDGRKLHKFELPIGQHPNPEGFEVVEVASKSELDQIVLDKSDIQIAAEKSFEDMKRLRESGKQKLAALGLINEEIRAMIG